MGVLKYRSGGVWNQVGVLTTPQWKGTWSSVTTYNPNDEVYYNGSSWISIASSTNVAPVEGASWTAAALAGSSAGADVAYAENTVGGAISTTSYVDMGVAVSWVTDGNPYKLTIDGLLSGSLGSATSPQIVQILVACVDADNANALVFLSTVKASVVTGGSPWIVPAYKRKRMTAAAGLTKNYKLQAKQGAAITGASFTFLADPLYPFSLSVEHSGA